MARSQKRKIVDDESTKYVIFGKKSDERPFELIFVQSDSKCADLHLETPSLSSRDCFSCNLLPLLEKGKNETELTIKTEGFSPAKTMIDLLTDSSSVDTYHTGWLKYLKYYQRFTIQMMEVNVLRHFFSHKKSDTSESVYLFTQLDAELKKKATKDPFFTLKYLLRASVSIHEHSQINEEEISELWKLMDQGQHFQLDPTDTSHAFGIALKKALIDQKLPFSLVYAWIGMIGFLAFPTSFTRLGWTDRGPTHAFQLKYPFCLRVAADPKSQCKAVFSSLQKNPEYLPVLIQIYHSLEFHSESVIYPHPLQECFKLDFETFFKEEWLAHPDASMRHLGMKLYLIAAGEGITNAQIDTLFYYLPKISKEGDYLQAIESFIKKLPEYRDALDLFKEKSPISAEAFIEALINTRQKPLAQLALRLWRKSNFSSKEIHWLIFNALTVFSPQEALKLLQAKVQEGFLKITEQCKGFLLLLDRSQKRMEIPFQFNELIPFFALLINSAAAISTEDKKKVGQKIFPILKSQSHLIDEELLLKASQGGFFETESLDDLWLTWLEHKLESGPVNSVGIFCYTLEEKKYIHESSRLQEFKVELGTRLLQEKDSVAIQKLLEELIVSSIQPTTLAPLYDLLSQFLTSELTQPHKELVPLLKYLVEITLQDKVEATTELIKILCKHAVDPELRPLAEELLTYPQTLALLKQDPKGHIPLLSYLEATSLQPIGSLETSKALFLGDEAKKLFSNHKDLVKKCAKKEAEKLLDASQHSEEELSFIFELFEFYLIYDENLWLKFLGALENKGSNELQTKGSALFKKIETIFPTQFVRAQCWVFYLKCLLKIGHPDILSYFDSLEYLNGIFPETDMRKRKAYQEVLFAQIALLSSNTFDQKHYEKIIDCYRSLGEEDIEIEKALICNVHTGSQKTCFQGVCARLTKIIVNFHENKDGYIIFVELIEGIFADGYQEKFIEEASGLLKAILSQKEYPQHSCVRILFFLQKSKIPFAFSLFERIIDNKHLLSQLQKPFLSLFPSALKHDSFDKIKEREAQLDAALNAISFEPSEEAKMVDAFLSRFFILCGNKEAIDTVETFAKWAIFLFEHPAIMKKHVQTMIQLSLSYADPYLPELQNLEKFSKCVQDVISIRYKMAQEVSKYKITRKSYLKWCMQCWKEMKLKEEFFAVAVDNLISKHIQEYGEETSFTSLDILDELEEFAFFWPISSTNTKLGTPYLLFEENQKKIDFDLSGRLEVLTRNARKQKIFKDHPMKLAEFWMYLQIPEEREFFQKDVLGAATNLISKLLSFSLSSQVFYSILLLNQWDEVEDKKLVAVFISMVEKVVEKCLKFPFAVYSKESLLKVVYQKTLNDLPMDTSRCPLILPMAKLQLDSTWKMYEHVKKLNLIQYKIHYLELCMDVLRRHLSLQGNNRDYKHFDEWLRKFIPEMISLEQQEWILDKENPLSICEKDGLIKNFLGLIREFENPYFPSNLKEKKIGQALIISLLDDLRAANSFILACKALAIIDKTISLFTPNDAACSACFGRVEKWLPQGPDFHSTDLEILGINFHSRNLLKDYPSYLNRVDKLFKDLMATNRAFEIQHSLVCVARMFAEIPENPSDENLALRDQFYSCFFQAVQKAFKDLPDDQDQEEIANGILKNLLEIAQNRRIKIT